MSFQEHTFVPLVPGDKCPAEDHHCCSRRSRSAVGLWASSLETCAAQLRKKDSSIPGDLPWLICQKPIGTSWVKLMHLLLFLFKKNQRTRIHFPLSTFIFLSKLFIEKVSQGVQPLTEAMVIITVCRGERNLRTSSCMTRVEERICKNH